MNLKKGLWKILGPVIAAFVLVLAVLFFPQGFGNVSSKTEQRAAVSLSNNIFKGNKIKSQAIRHGYVPFIGSSELARMDPMHPSSLAMKYHRGYKPFLLGKPGTQSIVHFFAMQGMMSELRNRKLVFVVSPQWFTKQGQMPEAFDYYYSPLETIDWVIHANNTVANRYAAKRLLTMPSASSSAVMKSAVTNIAAGKPITKSQRFYLGMEEKLLGNEDGLFSRFISGHRLDMIKNDQKQLPDKYNKSKLYQISSRLAAKDTDNNRFNIKNSFYNLRLRGRTVKNLKGAEASFNYTKSPEYSDLELMLNQFNRYHINVLFVIPPVNQKWAKYTGLSQKMYEKTDRKIVYQLHQQGFYHIADLTNDGGKKYFMEDTIHLGWNGWLKVDDSVDPFLTKKQAPYHYHIDNRFFSKKWQMSTKY